MSKAKPERNALIIELKKKGYTYQQIWEELNRRGYTGLKDRVSVKMRYATLQKAKKSIPISPRRQVVKYPATRQPVSKVARKARDNKMAFWLDEDMKEKLKIAAIKEKKTASEIVRKLLEQYLKNK